MKADRREELVCRHFCPKHAQAGLPTSGSTDNRVFPSEKDSDVMRMPSPAHGGGSVPDSHWFPFLPERAGANASVYDVTFREKGKAISNRNGGNIKNNVKKYKQMQQQELPVFAQRENYAGWPSAMRKP